MADLVPEEAIGAALQKLPTLVLRAQTQQALEAAAPLILAAELERLAGELADRANARHAVAGDDGQDCDGECESSDCHTVSAVATYSMTAGRLRARASVLRGEGDPK